MAETPEICTGGAFRIAADGTWFHDGAPIPRPALVRLFAHTLQRDEDGAYWLVTPVEKVPVAVEDAPFVAVELCAEGEGREARLSLRTNIDTWVAVDRDHPLVVRGDASAPRPYVVLGGGLEALVARSVYYELASRAAPGPEGPSGALSGVRLGVWSAGVFFPLVPEEMSV